MGIAYLSLDRNHDAVSALARASRMKPESAEYRSDLAAARIAFGTAEASHDELVRAVADADAALTLDPQSSAALFNRALALERLDRKEQAAHAYEAYLANDAKSKWADEVRFRLEHLRK